MAILLTAAPQPAGWTAAPQGGTASETHSGAVSISGGGALTAIGVKAAGGAASISGGGSVAATGTAGTVETHSGAVSISGGGQVAVFARKTALGAVYVTAGGQITAAGTATTEEVDFVPIYNPSGHPLLSPAAARLSPNALAAEAVAAESVLRRGTTALSDTAFEAGTAEYARAVLAVVYQVNYQMAAGVDAEVASSITRGDRSTTYRGGLVSPRAQSLVDALIPLTSATTGWPIVGSLR